jgi:hypothetical protein
MAKPVQFFFNKIEVKADVMGDEDGILRNIKYGMSNVGKNWGVSHHGV